MAPPRATPPRRRAGDEGPQRVALGYVARARGVCGQVAVEALTWQPERLAALSEVALERDGWALRMLRVEAVRAVGRGLLMKFAGVDSPEAARAQLVKGYLTVPREEVPAPPADTYYVFDILGCQVCDAEGRRLGQVEEVLAMPSTDVYAVRLDAGGQALVPAVRDFVVEVDVAGRRIVVRGIDELLP